MRRRTKSSTFGRMPRSARVAGDKEKPSIAIARLLQRPLTDRIQQGRPHGFCCGA